MPRSSREIVWVYLLWETPQVQKGKYRARFSGPLSTNVEFMIVSYWGAVSLWWPNRKLSSLSANLSWIHEWFTISSKLFIKTWKTFCSMKGNPATKQLHWLLIIVIHDYMVSSYYRVLSYYASLNGILLFLFKLFFQCRFAMCHLIETYYFYSNYFSV